MWVAIAMRAFMPPAVYGPFDEGSDAWNFIELELQMSGKGSYWVSQVESAIPKDAPVCLAHNPVQHRDAKPPWCNSCGLTAGWQVPKSSFRKD